MSAAERPAMLEVKRLSRHFKVAHDRTLKAVDDVSFSINAGEVLGLVGESGSGKSTLGKTALGLLDKTAGQVRLEGELLPTKYAAEDFRRLARRHQMIFQDPYSSLNPRMTVGEIIGEGLKLHTDLNSRQIYQRVRDWLAKVGLAPEHAGRYPHEFSGGQRQRIGVARALIMEPGFLVCDEPISALDVSVQAQVINLLDDLKHSMGLTMLFIAHDLSMVRHVSNRMAVMYLGSIVEIGPADEVFFKPLHPYTALLVAANPEADPATERTRHPELLRGEIPSPIDLPAGCRFANRCPKVHDRCRVESPKLITVAPEHEVACHLYSA